jgi:hypothetical protein
MKQDKEHKPVWPFPTAGQVKPIEKWNIGTEIEKVNLKVKNNEDKHNSKVARDNLDDALF